MPQDDNIVSIDQFDTNLVFNFPRIVREEQWYNWYDNEFFGLYPSNRTVENGLLLHEAVDRIKVPLFKLVSEFYVDAILADRPAVSTTTKGIIEWLETNGDWFYKVLDRGVRNWAITGRGIMVTHEGEDGVTLQEVPSTAYFRVGPDYDPDELVGHIIAYRYHEFDETERRNPGIYLPPNRIRVVRYSEPDEINTVQTFEYSGSVTGSIGRALTPQEPAGVTSLCTFGRGDGWYDDAADLAAKYMIRMTNNDRALNLSDARPMILPPGLLEGMTAVGPPQDPSQKLAAFRKMVNPALQRDQSPGSADVGYVGEAFQYGDEQELLEYYILIFMLVTGVPPTAFGQMVGKGESGDAREMTMHRAAARARSVRQDIRGCLPRLIRALGAPRGNVTFFWPTSPFEDRRAKQEEVTTMLGAGIIDAAEAREMLGLSPRDDMEQQGEQRGEENEGDSNEEE